MRLILLILFLLPSLILHISNVYAGEKVAVLKAQKSSMCVAEIKKACRVNTTFGTYYVPKGWKESSLNTKKAILIDLGGPGILPGSLERFEYSVLPNSMLKNRLVIILGADWGVPSPSKECSDLLQRHVLYVRGKLKDKPSVRLIADTCQMKEVTSKYAKRSASLIRRALFDWGIESYEVVGASYAASRWQGMINELEPRYLPESLTIVSPLVADTPLNVIAKWQANMVDSVWKSSCNALEAHEAIAECHDVVAKLVDKNKISGLMMLAWSPMASDEFAGYVGSSKDQLGSLVKNLSDQYFFLNSVDYPRDELFEHLIGVCSSVVINNHNNKLYNSQSLISKNVMKMIDQFYSVCSELNQSYGNVSHNIPTCYIELANERVTPPSVSSIHGVTGNFKNIIHFSEKPYFHGDFRVLNEINHIESCESEISKNDSKIVELTSGLLEIAKQSIGVKNFFIPVLSEKYKGEFHLANIMLAKEKNKISFVEAGNKVEEDEIVGYCLTGWLVPDSGGKGRSYLLSIGLNGNKSPSCERQKGVKKHSSRIGNMSITESFSCPLNENCYSNTRDEISFLTNRSKLIQL